MINAFYSIYPFLWWMVFNFEGEVYSRIITSQVRVVTSENVNRISGGDSKVPHEEVEIICWI